MKAARIQFAGIVQHCTAGQRKPALLLIMNEIARFKIKKLPKAINVPLIVKRQGQYAKSPIQKPENPRHSQHLGFAILIAAVFGFGEQNAVVAV
ncbi:hypothetical protein D3C71_1709890 [compost metagenome]